MIRLTCCHHPDRAARYFKLLLAPGDDPQRSLISPVVLRAQWIGPALPLADLGPFSPPASLHLVRLARGLHPLDPRRRLAPALNRTRAYYDVTVCAPKTVSLAALLRPEHPSSQNVLHAHLHAVRAVCDALPPLLYPQNSKGPRVDKWLGIAFAHTHTREGDPHLHSHVVIPNLARNTAGQWRALQLNFTRGRGGRLGLVYGTELARQLRRAGFAAGLPVRTGGLPEIRSLKPLRPEFSRARQAILKAEAAELARGEARRQKLREQAAAAGQPAVPPPPAPDRRRRLDRRRLLAEGIRRPKPRLADDPATLGDEARRWSRRLSGAQAWAVLQTLDAAALAARAATRTASAAPVPSVRAIVRAAYARIPTLTLATNELTLRGLLRAAVKVSGGRHPLEDLERACARAWREAGEAWDEFLGRREEDLADLVRAEEARGWTNRGLEEMAAAWAGPAPMAPGPQAGPPVPVPGDGRGR